MFAALKGGATCRGESRRRLPTLGLLWLAALLLPWSGCASIPSGQYGVTKVEWLGVDEVNSDAIEACLVTRERGATVLRLGLGAGSCGEPPFDSSPPKIVLWTMPWSEWPVYDSAIFDLDIKRIQRWYRARGFYDTRVLAVRTYVDGHFVAEPADCDSKKSDCELEVVVQVEEGAAVRVADVSLESKASLPTELLEKITDELTVKRGERFDEYAYEEDKKEIQKMLWNDSYARANVSGRVAIDREKHTARVVYQLDPGPECVFGTVTVQGADDVPVLLILQAADIPEGKRYSYDRVLDAEQAVFTLGAFSSVQLKPQGEGRVVDMIAAVRVGRLTHLSGGIGVMSGTLQKSVTSETASVPQWDIHLSAVWEDRNFLGGLRDLRIEDRPRLIQLAEFPQTTSPHPGNLLSIKFEQPATFERRTTLFSENQWDYGPDPYLGFFRHDLSDNIGLSRNFWRQRIRARAAIGHDLYEITSDEPPDSVSSYRLPYLEQHVTLDLRNNAQRPKRGIYLSIAAQEAFKLGGYGSWDYLRLAPDLRGYVPLMWDFVLAARFALGALVIYSASSKIDPVSRQRGPQPYRMRGGGANSDRGFGAGKLGVGTEGGVRRWEGSLELRIPLGSDFGAVLFGDVGDVNAEKRFRFDHLNAAVGFGLRYFTIIGAVRFDAGWRIPSLQVVGDAEEPSDKVRVKVWPSAAHLTIGEAF